MFNFYKVYAILDEIFLAGEIEETSKSVVLKRLEQREFAGGRERRRGTGSRNAVADLLPFILTLPSGLSFLTATAPIFLQWKSSNSYRSATHSNTPSPIPSGMLRWLLFPRPHPTTPPLLPTAGRTRICILDPFPHVHRSHFSHLQRVVCCPRCSRWPAYQTEARSLANSSGRWQAGKRERKRSSKTILYCTKRTIGSMRAYPEQGQLAQIPRLAQLRRRSPPSTALQRRSPVTSAGRVVGLQSESPPEEVRGGRHKEDAVRISASPRG